MMKYKAGDKVVVEIKFVDRTDKFATYEVGHAHWIANGDVLGKPEDFTKPKKIKFSEVEKAEFNKLRTFCWSPFEFLEKADFDNYPHLHKRLFQGSFTDIKQNQIEFVRAIEHPELIEVVKEKKYRLKILDDCYLGRNTAGNACLAYKTDASSFTQSEIDRMQKLSKFQAIDLEECKEEAEDE